jgi:catalase
LTDKVAVPATLPSGEADPGVLFAKGADAKKVTARFIAAIAMHRHTARDQDPPLL